MIIQSILDTDLYKFTVSYSYMKLYPDAEGTFTFNDRDNTEYTEEFVEELDPETESDSIDQAYVDEIENWIEYYAVSMEEDEEFDPEEYCEL